MLHESIDFSPEGPKLKLGEMDIFRFCTFDGLSEEETFCLDADFISCSFKNCTFYWSCIPADLFYNCTFENCTFMGASFAGCTLVQTSFVDCTFTTSNLGNGCRFYDSKLFECTQIRCTGWENKWANGTTK